MPSVIIDVVQGQVEDFTNVNDLDPMTAILFEANLISEVSLSYQDGHIQPAEFELLVSSTKLRDDAKLLLREILNIYSDEAS